MTASYPTDLFFDGFGSRLRQRPSLRAQYHAYDRAFATIDDVSWGLLKRKAISHFLQHRPGQLKEGFFNQLNEAFAYQYLTRRGHSNVRFVAEDGVSRPDIEYRQAGRQKYCEVKTIGLSQNEISRRKASKVVDGSVSITLDSGFFQKLNYDVCQARAQIEAQGGDGLVFLLAKFDDFTLDYYDRYRRQIASFLHSHPAPEVYMKIDLLGNRRIHKTRPRNGA